MILAWSTARKPLHGAKNSPSHGTINSTNSAHFPKYLPPLYRNTANIKNSAVPRRTLHVQQVNRLRHHWDLPCACFVISQPTQSPFWTQCVPTLEHSMYLPRLFCNKELIIGTNRSHGYLCGLCATGDTWMGDGAGGVRQKPVTWSHWPQEDSHLATRPPCASMM